MAPRRWLLVGNLGTVLEMLYRAVTCKEANPSEKRVPGNELEDFIHARNWSYPPRMALFAQCSTTSSPGPARRLAAVQ